MPAVRSTQRSAVLTLRMSPEERHALELAAQERGACMGDLLRDAILPDLQPYLEASA